MLAQPDLHRMEAFHSQGLGKMHRIRATFYTKALAPDQPTTSNQQMREQSSQPPLTHHINRAQLKLFGHVLKAPENCLARSCCFFFDEIFSLLGRRGGIRYYEKASQNTQDLATPPAQGHPQFPFVFDKHEFM